MAKNELWFQAIFAEAAKKEQYEFARIQAAINLAIKGGEYDKSYLRNMFEYESSELSKPDPSKTLRQFFDAAYASTVNTMREGMMYAAVRAAWGVNLQGKKDARSVLLKYAEMVERNLPEIKITPNKANKIWCQTQNFPAADKSGKSFTLNRAQMCMLVKRVTTVDITATEKADVDGEVIEGDTLDAKFEMEYERKLTKLIPCREARLSTFGFTDDTNYDEY